MNESADRTNPNAEKNVADESIHQKASDEKSGEAPYEDINEGELRALLIKRDANMEQLQSELVEANDARLRKAAELDNYRKRVQRERSKIYDTARVSALEDFLSVNDDLTRTIEASEKLDVNQTFLEGVQLVAGKFDEVLKKQGVERINETGVPFNVDVHDALMRKKPDDDTIRPDTVLEIIENGYKIGDRIIRHAKVIVSE